MTIHHDADNLDSDYWEDRADQIQFLHKKLNWLREEIEEEYEEFPSYIKEWKKEEGIEQGARAQLLEEYNPQDYPKGGYIMEEILIDKVSHPLSYLLESYMLERKRCIEHALKLLRDTVNPNKAKKSFSLSGFVGSLEDFEEGNLDKNSWQLGLNFVDRTFLHEMVSFKDFFNDARGTRTRLAHYQAEVSKDIVVKFEMAERKKKQANIERF
jgi:hypothetical protein